MIMKCPEIASTLNFEVHFEHRRLTPAAAKAGSVQTPPKSRPGHLPGTNPMASPNLALSNYT